MERFAKESRKVAVKWENEDGETKEITYEAFNEKANKIGNVFLENGLKKGDVVLVIIPRLIEAYQVYLAALKVGLVVIPSSEMLRTKDLQYRITHGDVKGVISYYPYIGEFERLQKWITWLSLSLGMKEMVGTYLDEEMKAASDELAIADTNRDDMAFLSYTSGTTGNPKGGCSYTWLGICAFKNSSATLALY